MHNTDDTETPDFSGDDLGHLKSVQEARAEREAHEQLLNDSIRVLTDSLGVTETTDPDFQSFLMFSSIDAIPLRSFVAHHRNTTLHVSLVEYDYTISSGKYRYAGHNEYLFGHLTLTQSYPRTYACKETLSEKLADLLLRTDVDVDHSKQFSSAFHVVTTDAHQLRALLQAKNLDLLAPFPDLEFELFGNACLFRYSKKPVTPELAVSFAEVAKLMMQTWV